MKNGKLPESLREYFWDVDFDNLDPSQKQNFVIERLLDKGDDKAASWVINNYSKDIIKETFRTMRDFSPKTANFWKIYFNIPKSQILCLQEPYLRLRRNHWPY